MTGNKRKVLIVEDEALILRFLDKFLEKDYEVKTASNGIKALEVLTSYKPDFILLDVMMPGMDGIEVCQTIRADSKFDNTWILFVSAKVKLEDRLKGYQVGGDDYLIKPFDGPELLAKLKAYTRRVRSDEMVETTQLKNIEIKSTSFFSNPKFTTLLYELSNCKTQIIYIKAESPYCKFICDHRDDDYCRIRVALKEVQLYFKEYRLLQVHRSYLVNPQMIINLKQKTTHDYDLLMKSNKQGIEAIPVGRSYVAKLKEILEL